MKVFKTFTERVGQTKGVYVIESGNRWRAGIDLYTIEGLCFSKSKSHHAGWHAFNTPRKQSELWRAVATFIASVETVPCTKHDTCIECSPVR